MQIANAFAFAGEVGVLAALVTVLTGIGIFVKGLSLTHSLGWETKKRRGRLTFTLLVCGWLFASAVYGCAATLVRLFHAFD